MSEWQPIETIPTDRSRVLMWVTDPHFPGARLGSAYKALDGTPIAKPEGCNGDWTDAISHWMPIPEPPK